MTSSQWWLMTLIAILPERGFGNGHETVELTLDQAQWMLTLQSAAAQPNGGRLGAYLSGYVLGAIQSA